MERGKEATLRSGICTVTVTFKDTFCPICNSGLKEGDKIYSYDVAAETVYVHVSCNEEFEKTVTVRRRNGARR